MPRKKNTQKDTNREQEVLNSQVRLDGQGEDPAVKTMLSPEFQTMSNLQVLEVSVALRQLIQGQTDLIDQVAKLAARMNEYDEMAKRFEADRKKFLDEMSREADKHRLSDDKKKELEERVNTALDFARADAKLNILNSQKKFDEELKTMPKVVVRHPGVIVNVNVDGLSAPRVEPMVIRIKHHVWIIPPNVDVEVPLVVAQVLEQRLKSMEENRERKKVLSADKQNFSTENADYVVAQKLSEINKKYNSNSDAFPLA